MSNLTVFNTLGASKLMGKVEYNKYSEYYYNIFETILNNLLLKRNKNIFNILS